MKILGIIAEYNPFHNGHKYQIEKAKEISAADYIIVIMSGNYVQRGAPAVFNKKTRAEMAINAGVDAVFEMPSFFSCASAPDFSDFGISLLQILGADYISFGTENNDYKLLNDVADILLYGDLESNIKKYISSGLNYAKARHNAIIKGLKGNNTEQIESILASPNNILAIEYLKNIKLKKFDIEPVIISRCGSGYHEKEIEENKFSSATAIRKLMAVRGYRKETDFTQNIIKAVPKENIDLLKKNKPVFEDDFLFTLQRNILDKLKRGENLTEYCDMSGELANTVEKNIYELKSRSYTDFILNLKSKNFTYTRISRALFHILLNHKKQDLKKIKSGENISAYPLLLGFKKDSSELLSELKRRSKMPIISKISNAKDILSEKSLKIFENNIYADFLYNSIYCEKYGESLINPYRSNVVIL